MDAAAREFPIYWTFFTGVAVCVFLLWAARTERLSVTTLLYIAAGTGLFVRVLFSFQTPLFFAPDEESHFKYIQHLAEQGSFPVQTSIIYAKTKDWEYFQPPLYYLLTLPVYFITKFFNADLFSQVRAIRLMNVVFWLAHLFVSLKILRNIGFRSAAMTCSVVVLLSLVPSHAFTTSVINNDGLLILLLTAVIYFATQRATLRSAVWMGVLMGLAFWTKFSAVLGLVFLVLFFGLQIYQKKIQLGKAGLILAVVFGLVVLIWWPLGIRNWILYRSISGVEYTNVAANWATPLMGLMTTTKFSIESFWGAAGIYNNVRLFVSIGYLFFYLLFFGGLLALLNAGWKALREKEHASLIAAFVISVVFNFALMIWYGYAYGQAQGRYLLPLITPLAICAGLVIEYYTRNVSERLLAAWMTGASIVLCATFLSFSLTVFSLV